MFCDDLSSDGTNYGFAAVYPPSYMAGTNWWELKADNNGKIVQRHFDGANVAYADGHAKWSKLPGPLTASDTQWDLN